MNRICMESIDLVTYDDELYKSFKDKLVLENTNLKFISQVGERLENSKFQNDGLFQTAYVVLMGEEAVGYVYFSAVRNDEVFLELEVDSEHRGKGYGKLILNEVSDYLFNNCNIKSIMLDIDPSNEKSIRTAESCGFYPDEDDFESRRFTGKIVFIKDSNCYVSKRRIG